MSDNPQHTPEPDKVEVEHEKDSQSDPQHNEVTDSSSAQPTSPARSAILALRQEIHKVIEGQDPAVTGLVAALLVRGHVLLEGVPGVAKTLLVKSLAAALDLDFKRVQFTPDLMPSDVTGQLIYRPELKTKSFEFRKGPVFTNLLLADEINRTPAKTQAALLEAMGEFQVTNGGQSFALPDPFFVVATQNPIEYEGTYPLPEAQLDRFMFKLNVGYPSSDEEVSVLSRHASAKDVSSVSSVEVKPVATPAHLAEARGEVARLKVDPKIQEYIVALARATRTSPSLSLGVSTRGAAMLLHAARAWSWLRGGEFVTPDDVKVMVKPTWRHRLIIRPDIALEGVDADGVLDGVMANVAVPR